MEQFWNASLEFLLHLQLLILEFGELEVFPRMVVSWLLLPIFRKFFSRNKLNNNASILQSNIEIFAMRHT